MARVSDARYLSVLLLSQAACLPVAYCTVQYLADVVLQYPSTGVARAMVWLDLSGAGADEIVRLLRVYRRRVQKKQLESLPAGVCVHVTDEDDMTSAAAVTEAVLGCRNLRLNIWLEHDLPMPQLYAAVRLHGMAKSITTLTLESVLLEQMAPLMHEVAAFCTGVLALRVSVGDPIDAMIACNPLTSDDAIALIWRSIARMRNLQHLAVKCRLAFPSAESLVAPVLSLAKLQFLELSHFHFTHESMAMLLSVLARRASPIDALALPSMSVSIGMEDLVMQQLSQPDGVAVLTRLLWLDMQYTLFQGNLVQPFINNVVPHLSELRHLSLHLTNQFVQFSVTIVSMLPRLKLLQHLDISCFQQRGIQSLLSQPAHLVSVCTSSTLRNVLGDDGVASTVPGLPASTLGELHVLHLDAKQDMTRMFRDALPCMQSLSMLSLDSAQFLHPPHVEMLQHVLPTLPSLTCVDIELPPDHWFLLRLLFARFPRHSLAQVKIRCWNEERHSTVPIPLQVVNAAVSVLLTRSEHHVIEFSAGFSSPVYYHCPDEQDTMLPPPEVPSLYSLAAAAVLRQLPSASDLTDLPRELTRGALLAEMSPCVECGVFRLLAELLHCCMSGSYDGKAVEVQRCTTCCMQGGPMSTWHTPE